MKACDDVTERTQGEKIVAISIRVLEELIDLSIAEAISLER